MKVLTLKPKDHVNIMHEKKPIQQIGLKHLKSSKTLNSLEFENLMKMHECM